MGERTCPCLAGGVEIEPVFALILRMLAGEHEVCVTVIAQAGAGAVEYVKVLRSVDLLIIENFMEWLECILSFKFNLKGIILDIMSAIVVGTCHMSNGLLQVGVMVGGW